MLGFECGVCFWAVGAEAVDRKACGGQRRVGVSEQADLGGAATVVGIVLERCSNIPMSDISWNGRLTECSPWGT